MVTQLAEYNPPACSYKAQTHTLQTAHTGQMYKNRLVTFLTQRTQTFSTNGGIKALHT